MEGPRSLKPEELPLLSRLEDEVFIPGKTNEMFRLFPRLFCEDNAENLSVFADEGRIVACTAMTLRWADLAGCRTGVSCLGAVATDEAYRGRGLASQLMTMACEKAEAWGADLMMISGGRGLYRRLGAADIGHDFKASVDEAAARKLQMEGVVLSDFSEADLTACISLYQRKAAHYIRPLEDWQAFTRDRVCMVRDADFYTARLHGTIAAYYVVGPPRKPGEAARLMEFGGEPTAVAAGLSSLLAQSGASAIQLHLQEDDAILKALLESAGISPDPSPTEGTILLLNVPRFVERMRPLADVRLGTEMARTLEASVEGDRHIFRAGGEECTADGKQEAAALIFGSPGRPQAPGIFGDLFPIPSLWYGLSYI